MNHLARLIGDGGREPFVTMAERANSDAGEQIEILTPFRVEHAHALAAHQHDRRAAVGLDDVLRLEFADAFHYETFLRASRLPAREPLVIRVLFPAPGVRPCCASTNKPFRSLPSATNTSRAPRSMALRQAASLAIIPAVAPPLRTI